MPSARQRRRGLLSTDGPLRQSGHPASARGRTEQGSSATAAQRSGWARSGTRPSPRCRAPRRRRARRRRRRRATSPGTRRARARSLEDVLVRVLPVGDQRRIDLPAAAKVETPVGDGRAHERERTLVEVAALGGAGKLTSRRARVASRRAPRSCLERDAAELDRLLHGRCAVVSGGDNMAVDVDERHACGHGSRGLTSRDAPRSATERVGKEAVAAELRLRGSDANALRRSTREPDVIDSSLP